MRPVEDRQGQDLARYPGEEQGPATNMVGEAPGREQRGEKDDGVYAENGGSGQIGEMPRLLVGPV